MMIHMISVIPAILVSLTVGLDTEAYGNIRLLVLLVSPPPRCGSIIFVNTAVAGCRRAVSYSGVSSVPFFLLSL